jgi:hypothetical protein
MNGKFLYQACQLKMKLLLLLLVGFIYYPAGAYQIQDISVSRKKNKVTISWSVTSVQQNVYYEIERAGQDKVFKTAGILFPAESAPTANKFTFKESIKHKGPAQIIYYRVKQINANGTAEYSLIKSIHLSSNKIKNADEVVLIYHGVYNYTYQSKKYNNSNSTNKTMAGILKLKSMYPVFCGV